jgi:hypothetical protein
MSTVRTWSCWFAFLTTAFTPFCGSANTGIFEGSGHTIKLVKSEDVEMRSEDVTIVPGRGPFLFNDSAMDRVEYRCKFVLHNRSKKRVAIQVGFPLNSQFMGPPGNPDEYDETTLVLKYKFIVRDKGKTYHVRFVPRDKDKKLATIFLWDMSFEGDEVRTLHVAYEIPMATGLSNTDNKWPEVRYAKAWYWSTLTPCLYEGVDYVTVTGQSWAGPIRNATFRLNVSGFEQYLRNRFLLEQSALAREKLAAFQKADREYETTMRKSIKGRVEEANSLAKKEGRSGPPVSESELEALLDEEMRTRRFDYWHIRDRLIYRQTGPDGWKEKDGTITWEFKDYQPREPIRVSYFLTTLPKTPDGIPSFVKAVLGKTPSRGDLSDLREIYLAWWGIVPKSKSVREFVSNQVWYSPKSDMTVDKLTAEQKAVVSAIEKCSAGGLKTSP